MNKFIKSLSGAVASVMLLTALSSNVVFASTIVSSGAVEYEYSWTLDSDGKLEITPLDENYNDCCLWRLSDDVLESANEVVLNYYASSRINDFDANEHLNAKKVVLNRLDDESIHASISLLRFNNTDSIDFGDGSFSDVSIYQFAITSTDCIPKGIDSLCISDCPDLTRLECDSIDNLNIDGLPKLETLSLPDEMKEFRIDWGVDMSDLVSSLPSKIDMLYLQGTNISSINIPSTYKTVVIGDESLKTAKVQKGRDNINWGMFRGCKSLNDVNIPDGVTTLEYLSFYGCSSLKKLDIPSSVKKIEGYSFEGSGLESVKIPAGVKEIEYSTFASCKSLESVTIPDSVKRIDDTAFDGCTDLKDVYFGGTETEWYSISTDSIYNRSDVLSHNGRPIAQVVNNAKVHFMGQEYAIIANAFDNGSTHLDKTTAKPGDKVNFNFIPDDGYELDSFTVKTTAGADVAYSGDGLDYCFVMPESPVIISASVKLADYKIEIIKSDGGKVTSSVDTAHMGDTVELNNVPEEGYKFSFYNVEDAFGHRVNVKDGKFTMPASGVKVRGVFQPLKYSVDVQYDSDAVTVKGIENSEDATVGTVYNLTVRPIGLNKIESITVNGEDLEISKTGTYEIAQPADDLVIIITTVAIDVPDKGWVSNGYDKFYFVDGQMVKGWKEIKKDSKKSKYYFDKKTGVMVTGIKKISKKLYWFADSGALKTGWYKNPDGTKYYFTQDGAVTGWKTISKKKYYFDKTTSLMVTGAKKISKKYYVFSAKGVMQKSGWKQAGSDWYYLKKDGTAYTKKWIKKSKKWYYFGSNAKMVKGKSLKIGKKTYKFDKNGVCKNP